MRALPALTAIAFLVGASTALAAPRRNRAKPKEPQPPPSEPAPTPASLDKLDAKALMQSGLKLYAAKDFLGALAVFRTAYARFPSAKILLNIGTTLTRLERKAEAANIYQRYLDSADADPAKRGEVGKVLAELDASVAILDLSISPADAEIQINDDEWTTAGAELRLRIAPGPLTVRARHPSYKAGEQSLATTAGGTFPIALALAELPPPPPPLPAISVDSGVLTTATVEQPRSRFGVIALAHIDFVNAGGAGLVGITADVTSRLQVQAAAILSRDPGGYAGASFALLRGKLRPILSAGMPVFISNGARFAVRGAGGLEVSFGRHLALIAELGVEYLLNPEFDVQHDAHALFIPALGAAGRL